VIRVLAKPIGAEEFNPISPDEIAGAGQLVWVDATDDTPAIADLLSRLDIRPASRPDSTAEVMSSVEEADTWLELTFPSFQIEDDGDIAPAAVTAYLSENALVTVHEHDSAAINRVWDATDRSPTSTMTMAHLCSLLMSSISRQVVPLIEELERRIDRLEELAFAADPRTLTEVQALRRDVITLRRTVGRQRDLADDLGLLVHPSLSRQGQEAFRRTAEHNSRLVDLLDSARNLLQAVSETYRGAVADQTNEIVRLLTVFSAILLPLGLIAGIFGMNFVSIPAGTEEWGFWASIGVMLAIAIGLWVFFARRGFIGAPRLRDLPKAVGLGIVFVGTAPVRVLASGVETTIQHLDPRRRGSQESDGD
jgi:magnesium transporter